LTFLSLYLCLGCLFHFSQCVWRHVQSNGLSNKYKEDDLFRLNIRKLIALAFVPTSDVAEAFELVAAELEDEAEKFLDYFEKTWIGEPKKRGEFKISTSWLLIYFFRLARSWEKEATIRSQNMECL
jgi:hypothetical protein